MLKKITIMLLVALFVMTGVVGAVTLQQNSALYSEVYLGRGGSGVRSDFHRKSRTFAMFFRGIPINRFDHASYNYKCYYLTPEGERVLKYEDTKPLIDYHYNNNLFYLMFSLGDLGPHYFEVELNTGEKIATGVWILGENEDPAKYNDKEEIEGLRFHTEQNFLDSVEKYHFK